MMMIAHDIPQIEDGFDILRDASAQVHLYSAPTYLMLLRVPGGYSIKAFEHLGIASACLT